jgi:arsenate reductase
MTRTEMNGKHSPFSKTICRRRPPPKNHVASRIVAPLRRREIQDARTGGEVMGKSYNVLFLCTGNSARSIMAEAILNRKGRPNFTAYSAGSHPSGLVRPEALKQIELSRMSTEGLRSKSWDEFAKPDAPRMDFVFTVCDNAAKEICPVWPGQPMTAHWGVPDPAALNGSPEQIEIAFRDAFMILERRISLFLSLPLSTLGQLAIKKEIDRIGRQ